MKSIYKKILLWVFAALVISMMVFFAVTRSIEMRLGINDLFIIARRFSNSIRSARRMKKGEDRRLPISSGE